MARRRFFCSGGVGVRKHHRTCDGLGCTGLEILRPRRTELPRYSCCQKEKPKFAYHLPECPAISKRRRFMYHSSCVCNHYNALFGRVAKCTPKPNSELVRTLLTPIIKEMTTIVGIHAPIKYEKVYEKMDSRRRERYRRAQAKLSEQRYHVTEKQSRITMFVKREAIEMKKDKVNPDCRAIQYRDPVYCLALASMIKTSEHTLYGMKGRRLLPRTRFIAKNMNNFERAECLRSKYEAMQRYGRVRVYEFDASRFDAHVNKDLLEVEHSFWRGTCKHPQLDQLLKWQLVNRGAFRVGDFKQKYEVQAGRMSGDANTAAGNCIIMSSMLAAFGQHLGRHFDFLCDGDDSVFFTIGEDLKDDEITNFFEQFGMDMKVEARPDSLEKIGFCQGHPVLVDDQIMMVRDPTKILDRWSINWKYANPRERIRRIRTLAQGELSLNKGIPVLQPLFERILSLCGREDQTRKLITGHVMEEYRYRHLLAPDWQDAVAVPIQQSTRESFTRAWGISLEDQANFERRLSSWEPSFLKEAYGGEITISSWGEYFPYVEDSRNGLIY